MTAKAKTKPAQLEVAEMQQARTFVGDAWRQFRKHKLALIAVGVLLVIVLGALVGPAFWTIDPTYIDIVDAYQLSSAEHPWGTDSLGRDTLARALQGGRVSLMIGISAMFVSITIGTVIGLASGYFRRLDNPLMRMTDIFIALPQLAAAAGADDALSRTAESLIRRRRRRLPFDGLRYRRFAMDADRAARAR